jgi:hypothetical protein
MTSLDIELYEPTMEYINLGICGDLEADGR